MNADNANDNALLAHEIGEAKEATRERKIDSIIDELVGNDEYVCHYGFGKTRYTLQDSVALKVFEDDGDDLVLLLELLAKIDMVEDRDMVKKAEADLKETLKGLTKRMNDKVYAVANEIAGREI
jgi:hypothetical protein